MGRSLELEASSVEELPGTAQSPFLLPLRAAADAWERDGGRRRAARGSSVEDQGEQGGVPAATPLLVPLRPAVDAWGSGGRRCSSSSRRASTPARTAFLLPIPSPSSSSVHRAPPSHLLRLTSSSSRRCEQETVGRGCAGPAPRRSRSGLLFSSVCGGIGVLLYFTARCSARRCRAFFPLLGTPQRHVGR
ncbi:unnamed protein product [Urochloa humidicola]